jgi:hypothetical protein
VVVAESAPNRDEYPELERVVRYFDEDSADAMLRAVDGALSGVTSAHKNLAPGEDANAKNLDAKNLDATGATHATLTAAAIAASQRRFAFLFERFLVGVGFVPLANATALDAPLDLPALVTIRHAWVHRMGSQARIAIFPKKAGIFSVVMFCYTLVTFSGRVSANILSVSHELYSQHLLLSRPLSTFFQPFGPCSSPATSAAKPAKAAPTAAPTPTARKSMSPPPPPLPPSLANLDYVLMSAPEHHQVYRVCVRLFEI